MNGRDLELESENMSHLGTQSTCDNEPDVIEVTDSVSNVAPSALSIKQASAVWRMFTLKENGAKAKCNICAKMLTRNPKTTSNLLTHVRGHTAHWERVQAGGNAISTDKQQQDIRDGLHKMRTLFTQEALAEHIVQFVVKQDLPFTTVETKEFRELVCLLNPKANLFKADTLKRQIMGLFEVKSTDIVVKMAAVDSKVSFTTDIWTSPMQVPFMAVTEHYIDSDWNLHAELLDFICVLGSHSGKRIYEAFDSVITDKYGFGERIMGITCDNASNNDAFINTLIETNTYFRKENHFHCFAHVVNLAVQAALGVKSVEVAALRACIKAVRLFPLKIERLRALCENIDPKVKFVKPILDVPTRWNSTADMLERAIRLRKPLSILFSDMQDPAKDGEQVEINSHDWKVFEHLHKFLALFKEATLMACAEKYQSLSVVVPLYDSLLTHTENTINDDSVSEDLKEGAEACMPKLTAYYNVSSDACTIATVLDPRLRLEFYRSGEGQQHQEQVGDIFNLVNVKYLSDYAPPAQNVNEPVAILSAKSQMSSMIFKKRRVETASEFKEYCNQTCSSEETKPLVWWKENEKSFPNLARMARDYLAIPGSSASSERVFSGGRQLITGFRCSLSPETVRACMSMKAWL